MQNFDDKRIPEALKLFEAFTGHGASDQFDSTELPEDDVVVVVGNVEAIAYNAVRDGIKQSYQHEFRASSRPVLAVSHDGRRLYLLAGKYKFTERGIEDR